MYRHNLDDLKIAWLTQMPPETGMGNFLWSKAGVKFNLFMSDQFLVNYPFYSLSYYTIVLIINCVDNYIN